MTLSTLANGFVLGWSVAWPPGPINAEMIRRGLLPRERGGGFWAAWPLGIGACCGDFCWAFGVSVGAGVLLNSLGVRRVLAVVSFVLLLFLALRFGQAAWRIYRTHRAENAATALPNPEHRGGLLLGFLMVLTSPWNIGFWLAVIGAQPRAGVGVAPSIATALSVVLGAFTWTLVLSIAVKLGARIFARAEWQIATQALTALIMTWFAVRLVLNFP